MSDTSYYQAGRLVDILLFGPFLIWLSTHTRVPWIKAALFAGGSLTIIGNLRNYYMIEQVRSGQASTETLMSLGQVGRAF